jgi:hypothetical protein
VLKAVLSPERRAKLQDFPARPLAAERLLHIDEELEVPIPAHQMQRFVFTLSEFKRVPVNVDASRLEPVSVFLNKDVMARGPGSSCASCVRDLDSLEPSELHHFSPREVGSPHGEERCSPSSEERFSRFVRRRVAIRGYPRAAGFAT